MLPDSKASDESLPEQCDGTLQTFHLTDTSPCGLHGSGRNCFPLQISSARGSCALPLGALHVIASLGLELWSTSKDRKISRGWKVDRVGTGARWVTCSEPRALPVNETCRRAPPRAAVWHAFTFAAKRSEQSVSCSDAASGLTLTNISVLPSPPRHGCDSNIPSAATPERRPLDSKSCVSCARTERGWQRTCRRCVSLELRYGTCALRVASAEKTSPSALSDLLMLHASFCRWPSACDRSSRSLHRACHSVNRNHSQTTSRPGLSTDTLTR